MNWREQEMKRKGKEEEEEGIYSDTDFFSRKNKTK